MRNFSSIFKSLALGVAFCGALGCNKPDQESAEKAQRDAAEKARDAQREADEKIAAAKRDADKAIADAAAARNDVRTSVQKDIDAVDRKISYLKERGAKATGTAQKNVAAAQGEVEQRRSVVQADYRKLETETGSAWDAAKEAADRDLTALKAAVDSLETTITNKPAR